MQNTAPRLNVEEAWQRLLQNGTNTEDDTGRTSVIDVRRTDNVISTWNLPYLYFGALAELDPLADDIETWLVPHLLSIYSDRELSLRPIASDLLASMKNCIHAMMLPHNSIVRVKCNDKSLTFLLARLYLDLNCHSVVREAYVLETPSDEIFNNSTAVQLTVSESQMKLWKSALPAMAERCRDWEHLQIYGGLEVYVALLLWKRGGAG
jgi:hypothetical protein